MNKELFVTSPNPPRTKVGFCAKTINSRNLLEREGEYPWPFSIYKGRVTRCCPACNRAFVDIGMEADAFPERLRLFLELEDGGAATRRPCPCVRSRLTAKLAKNHRGFVEKADKPGRSGPGRGSRGGIAAYGGRSSQRRPRAVGEGFRFASVSQVLRVDCNGA